MITITRSLAKQLHSVFRKALGLRTAGPQPPVFITATSQGLVVRCSVGGFAVEYREFQRQPVDAIVVPFNLLKDVQGTKAEPVTITQATDDRVTAAWQEGAVPRQITADVPKSAEEVRWPFKEPKQWTENEPELLTALHAAALTTDDSSARYALGCLQLKGTGGEIVATDGRQVLKQAGYAFPFTDELLLHRSLVFGCKEFSHATRVLVAKYDTHAAFRAGPWTIYLPIEKEARFPKVEDVIPPLNSSISTAELAPADSEFLASNLSRLPGGNDFNASVTVDLNGSVGIRARNNESEPATELVLSNSQRVGEEMRFNTNRHFLQRAVELGFRSIHLFGPEAPALCCDDRRQYAWALLSKEGTIGTENNTISIPSPLVSSSISRPSRSTAMRKRSTPEVNLSQESSQSHQSSQPGPQQVVKRRSSCSATSSNIVEQAIALRSALRDALAKTNELVRSIKRQKKQDRMLKQTLASLKQLQSVA